jgi:hypothetical protein
MRIPKPAQCEVTPVFSGACRFAGAPRSVVETQKFVPFYKQLLRNVQCDPSARASNGLKEWRSLFGTPVARYIADAATRGVRQRFHWRLWRRWTPGAALNRCIASYGLTPLRHTSRGGAHHQINVTEIEEPSCPSF